MSDTAIKIQDLGKLYRLGEVGTGTLSHDLNRWWHRVRGKEDPYQKIGQSNNRTKKSESDYVWALRDINLEVKKGEVLGIIGRNGAGKSTLLKILSQVTSPTTGRVEVFGRIASLLEVGTGFHPELTGRENIFLNGAILGMRRHEIQKKFDEIVDFAGVEAYIDTPVKRYSSGMYVRLAFAVAAFLEPEILVVDEVLAVGDAEFQKKCLGRMKDVSVNEGRTVLFVSHNMAAIHALCDTAILIEDGRIVCHDEAAEAVEIYQDSAFAKLSGRQSVVISDKYRKLNTSREIELLEAELLQNGSNIFATRDPLNLRIKVRANLSQKSFRFAGSIFNKEGAKLATFFSTPVGLMSASDEKTFFLSLPHHNLGKGDYYFALSVGTGGNGKANVEFDIAHGILGFAITHDSSDGEPIIYWPKAWGAFSLHAQILEKK